MTARLGEELPRPFRFADGILRPSTAFVKRNPEQTQRTLLPVSGAEGEGVAVVADSSPAGGMVRALKDVVFNLNDGRWGFPSKVEDDPLLELVLPPVSGGVYPFAEKRRLLYVAMTRARNGAYLVADPVQPSTFVTELLKESDGLRQIGELAPECARCHRGRLRPLTEPNVSHLLRLKL